MPQSSAAKTPKDRQDSSMSSAKGAVVKTPRAEGQTTPPINKSLVTPGGSSRTSQASYISAGSNKAPTMVPDPEQPELRICKSFPAEINVLYATLTTEMDLFMIGKVFLNPFANVTNKTEFFELIQGQNATFNLLPTLEKLFKNCSEITANDIVRRIWSQRSKPFASSMDSPRSDPCSLMKTPKPCALKGERTSAVRSQHFQPSSNSSPR